MDNKKLEFINLFRSQYQVIKDYNKQSSPNELFDIVLETTEKVWNDEFKPSWTVELFNEYVGTFEAPVYPFLTDEESSNWYEKIKNQNSFFWMRYKQYLSRIKKWPQFAIDTIDSTTDDIMNYIGDPNSTNYSDRRGLVLGYVQSGKTANYTGLINKAFDSGYKLVIVLSGIHNDLRAQTQLRLEEEVVGISSQQGMKDEKLGVCKITDNDSYHLIQTLTTVENDISTQNFVGSYNLKKNRTLMVVKKNKDVLESLITKLTAFLKQVKEDISLMVIDDEADQASIDTNEAGEATTINRLIRELLELFNHKAYVGYTATPFANLLIDSRKETVNEGKDLYPKDFLLGLPKPPGYCGPDEFFNTEENASDERPSLVIELDTPDIDLLTKIKKASHANKFSEVPPQMLEAIQSFIIATTIRKMRNPVNEHNSMLIHTSRFKDVQTNIKEEVTKAFEEIKNEIEFYPNGELVKNIAALYKLEFADKTEQWNKATGDSYYSFTWKEVYIKMQEIVGTINIMEINGNSKDALEYNRYKEEGLNVIAIGGDKLSRGLTLEGLTISYYYRNTLMYDTLMQMGRWFGYRKGYIDLCRIYTSDDIASNFEHLAVAMRELREEFEKMKDSSETPGEFAIKMLAHPSMTLTSPLKMRTARISHTIYKKTLQQTRLFDVKETFYLNNMQAANKLVNTINPTPFKTHYSNSKTKTKYYMAENVPVSHILEFLKDYETKSESKVNSKRLADYVKLVNEKYSELKKWKIAVIEGTPYNKNTSVKLGNLKLDNAVNRGKSFKGIKDYQIDIKAIVAAGQEFFYMEDKVKDKDKMREKMSNKEGVLLIYPLNPYTEAFKGIDNEFSNKFGECLVPIGIAISFPDSKVDETEVYQINKTISEER